MPDLDVQKPHPKRSVIMWSGLVRDIPFGFQLADGTNGTDNLTSRFIRGAPNATDGGGTGGSDTVTLITAELPSHSHTLNDPAHSHLAGNGGGSFGLGQGDFPTSTNTPRGNVSGVTLGNTGSGNSHENRPAYFELAFIQRVI